MRKPGVIKRWTRGGGCGGRSSGLAGLLIVLGLSAAYGLDDEPGRVARLNQAFLERVRGLGNESVLAVTTILDGWEKTYRGRMPDSFVPDALAVLYPEFGAALQAFDAGHPAEVLRLLEKLRDHEDPFLAANAEYFWVRGAVELGRYEEVEARLAELEADQDDYIAHTPYAPHLWFIKSVCEARNLRFAKSQQTLDELREYFDDAPEAVRVGAAQLRLEIERREQGTLGEVGRVMEYVADRLNTADTEERVQERQRQIIAMLDKLIEQQEQQEQQGGGGSARPNNQQKPPRQAQQDPKQQSDAPGGGGKVGDLHAAPQANPGESWGKLPPAEREKILQSIREKFPSRYRQLVEQYYRALADEK